MAALFAAVQPAPFKILIPPFFGVEVLDEKVLGFSLVTEDLNAIAAFPFASGLESLADDFACLLKLFWNHIQFDQCLNAHHHLPSGF